MSANLPTFPSNFSSVLVVLLFSSSFVLIALLFCTDSSDQTLQHFQVDASHFHGCHGFRNASQCLGYHGNTSPCLGYQSNVSPCLTNRGKFRVSGKRNLSYFYSELLCYKLVWYYSFVNLSSTLRSRQRRGLNNRIIYSDPAFTVRTLFPDYPA